MSAELLTFIRVATELEHCPDEDYAQIITDGTLAEFLEVIPDLRAQIPVVFRPELSQSKPIAVN